jgi:hypothetical protein
MSVSEPGSHTALWAGDTEGDSYAGTGIYFVRMESPVETSIKKVVLLR